MLLTLAVLALGSALIGRFVVDGVIDSSPAVPTQDADLKASTATALVQAVDQPKEGEQEGLVKSISKAETYLATSGVALGLSIAGALVFPPLSWISVGLTVYVMMPVFRSAYYGLVHERRARMAVLDSVAVICTVLARFYVAAALTTMLYYAAQSILRRTEDNTRRSLVNIFGDQPRTVWIMRDGVEVEIPFEEVQSGDIIAISAGQVVPVDGVIREGLASIDQHMLTGEGAPVDKAIDDKVFAATLVLSGRIRVEVTGSGAETVAAQIGAILNQTADYRTRVDSLGERIGDKVALPMLGLGGLGFLAVGTNAGLAIVASNFIDNMRIGVPLGMLNFLRQASNSGILIKDGRVLEILGEVDTVAFDKTGTLTQEQPHVGEIHVCDGYRAETLLICAAAAEGQQTHPIAKAIRRAAADRGLEVPQAEDVSYRMSYGISAEVSGQLVRVGSARFMDLEGISIPEEFAGERQLAGERGYSLLFVAIDDQLAGMMEIRPTIRSEVKEVITALRERGLSLCVISGDQEAPTAALAAEIGIERYFAEVLPKDKAALIEKLQAEGRRVCFIGDGINDSIALKKANASISLSGATTLATDTAQVVLLDGSLQHLPQLFALGGNFRQRTRTTMHTTFGPMIFSIGGALFLGFGLYTALILMNLSLVASVGIAMRPARSDEN